MLDPKTKQILKFSVRSFYDFQRLRIQTFGRLQPRSTDIYLDEAFKDIKSIVKDLSIWKEFLEPIKGIGPTMTGVCISEFDIRKANTISSFWSFAGLGMEREWTLTYHIGKKGKPITRTIWAPSKQGVINALPKNESMKDKGFTIDNIAPTDSEFQRQKLRPNQYPSYNTFLKTRLIGVLAGCFIKSNSPYREYYDNYKNRKESSDWGDSKGHRDNAAKRYMIKMFLKDLWLKWRELEGLEIRPPYAEEYLNKKHHGTAINPIEIESGNESKPES